MLHHQSSCNVWYTLYVGIMASCHRNAFRITSPLWGESSGLYVLMCGESTGHLDSPHKRPVMRNVDVFVVVSLKKLMDKQLICQWSEAPYNEIRSINNNDPQDNVDSSEKPSGFIALGNIACGGLTWGIMITFSFMLIIKAWQMYTIPSKMSTFNISYRCIITPDNVLHANDVISHHLIAPSRIHFFRQYAGNATSTSPWVQTPLAFCRAGHFTELRVLHNRFKLAELQNRTHPSHLKCSRG